MAQERKLECSSKASLISGWSNNAINYFEAPQVRPFVSLFLI